MTEEAFYDYLEKHSTVSSQSAQESRKICDFNNDLYVVHQLFEDDSELNNIRSLVMVGNVCKKSPRFNASRTSSKTSLKSFQILNHKIDA